MVYLSNQQGREPPLNFFLSLFFFFKSPFYSFIVVRGLGWVFWVMVFEGWGLKPSIWGLHGFHKGTTLGIKMVRPPWFHWIQPLDQLHKYNLVILLAWSGMYVMQIGVITSVFARAQLPLSQEFHFHAYVGPGRVYWE